MASGPRSFPGERKELPQSLVPGPLQGEGGGGKQGGTSCNDELW